MDIRCPVGRFNFLNLVILGSPEKRERGENGKMEKNTEECKTLILEVLAEDP